MFSHFLLFDFHIFLDGNVKNWCVLNIRCFLKLVAVFAHHEIIKTHYVLHILGHGIVSLSLLKYCLFTLTHIYQDVPKNVQKTPLGASEAKRAEYVRMITCYLSLVPCSLFFVPCFLFLAPCYLFLVICFLMFFIFVFGRSRRRRRSRN